MFDELSKYKNTDHFFVSANNSLEDVCNAPKDRGGVILVYELKNGGIQLVYIGSACKVNRNGRLGKTSLYDTILNGHQFGELPRKKTWLNKIKVENIDALDVYWYVTFNSETADIPSYVAATIIQRFFDFNGCFPRWNTEM